MESLADFFTSPTEEHLDGLTKDQLFKVAEHYQFAAELPKGVKEQELKRLIKTKLVERSILASKSTIETLGPTTSFDSVHVSRSDVVLSFEQQKELLTLQMEHKRFEAEQKRLDEIEREKERQLEYERIKQRERENEIQLAKIDQEKERLRLLAEGRVPGSGTVGSFAQSESSSRIVETGLSNMIRFLPKFNERDPDIFFSLFEGIANDLGWSDSERTLLLQSVFTGKAQQAFISLSVSERKNYQCIKDAVLRAFEQVPEFYRQRFRNWRKNDQQTHTEVAREITSFFNRWCSSTGVNNFETLCNLVVLEQFKNIVPERLAIYINEHKVKTAAEAAVLADEYVLTHRGRMDHARHYYRRDESRPNRFNGGLSSPTGSRQDLFNVKRSEADSESRCRYCAASGHWKRDCPVLREKNESSLTSPRPQACAGSVTPFVCGTANVKNGIQFGRLSSAVKPGCEVPKSTADEQNESKTRHDWVDESYGPFIRTGFISLVGSHNKVPVRILRDTGAIDTFVAASVLPFSFESNIGGEILIQGIGMQTLSVPLHRIELECDLVKGEAIVAVRPSLPVKGVDVILGNCLSGSRMWSKVPSSPKETSSAAKHDECSNSISDLGNDLMDGLNKDLIMDSSGKLEHEMVVAVTQLPVLPPALIRSELMLAQKDDESLTELFAAVLPDFKMQSANNGYFILDGLLVRKRAPFRADLNTPMWQVVVPKSHRNLVLQILHGEMVEHSGVRKTYSRLLQLFYWPRLKRDVAKFIKSCFVCHPGYNSTLKLEECVSAPEVSVTQVEVNSVSGQQAEQTALGPVQLKDYTCSFVPRATAGVENTRLGNFYDHSNSKSFTSESVVSVAVGLGVFASLWMDFDLNDSAWWLQLFKHNSASLCRGFVHLPGVHGGALKCKCLTFCPLISDLSLCSAGGCPDLDSKTFSPCLDHMVPTRQKCLADVLYFLVISLLFSLFKGKIIWSFDEHCQFDCWRRNLFWWFQVMMGHGREGIGHMGPCLHSKTLYCTQFDVKYFGHGFYSLCIVIGPHSGKDLPSLDGVRVLSEVA